MLSTSTSPSLSVTSHSQRSSSPGRIASQIPPLHRDARPKRPCRLNNNQKTTMISLHQRSVPLRRPQTKMMRCQTMSPLPGSTSVRSQPTSQPSSTLDRSSPLSQLPLSHRRTPSACSKASNSRNQLSNSSRPRTALSSSKKSKSSCPLFCSKISSRDPR